MSIVFFAWGDVVEHGGHDHDRASGPSFARTTGEVEVAAPGKSGSGKVGLRKVGSGKAAPGKSGPLQIVVGKSGPQPVVVPRKSEPQVAAGKSRSRVVVQESRDHNM